MAKLNKAEAARATGKARQTIKNWIREGRLSTEIDQEGREVIDTAELERAFGPLKTDGSPQPRKVANRQLLDEIRDLKHQIEILNVKLDSSERESRLKDDVVTSKERHINELQEEKKLLLAERASNQDTPKKGWWIFGRKVA